MRDLASNVSNAVLIGAATLSADNTPVAVDLRGFDSAMILLNVGVGGITFSGTNKIEFVLTHSDDDSTYTNVTTADLNGADAIAVTNGIIKALTAAHASPAVYEFGYLGGKRYLKLLADFSGTHGTGTPIAASVVRGNPSLMPTA